MTYFVPYPVSDATISFDTVTQINFMEVTPQQSIQCALSCMFIDCLFFAFQEGKCKMFDGEVVGGVRKELSASAKGFFIASPVAISNLALGKSAAASSLFSGSSGALRAVDGILTGELFHTASGDGSPWWKVDLGAKSIIVRVKIYFRAGQLARAINYKFYLGDNFSPSANFEQETLVGVFKGPPDTTEVTIDISTELLEPRRYFFIHKYPNLNFLEFYEAQVFGFQEIKY